MHRESHGRFARIDNAAQDRANGIYRAILGWSLSWPKITLLIALGTFVGSFIVVAVLFDRLRSRSSDA